MSNADERSRQGLTPDQEAELIARRKAAEAEAELADERAKMAVIGGASFGVLGLIVSGIALLVFRDLAIAGFGTLMGFLGFGVITVAQYMKMKGN